MSDALKTAKEQVLYACKTMCSRGYVLGTSGNISARIADENLFVITPSSFPYNKMVESDLVVADMDGNIQPGSTRKPSVEFSMHRNIFLERPDVNAVVHTHSLFAIAAGSVSSIKQVPAVEIETVLYLGGDIDVVPFAPPGSPELAEYVKKTIGMKGGVILKNHGAIGVGVDMDKALLACDVIEKNSELYCRIKSMGEIDLMPEEFIKGGEKISRIIRGIDKP